MENPKVGNALRTLFWFLVLATTVRFALVPALSSQFQDVVLFRLAEFEAVLMIISLFISLKLFLHPIKKRDYNREE